jgi:hypothetical protein
MVIVVCSDLDQAGRRSGFRAAVKVVRSIASNDATAPIVDASGRFKDIAHQSDRAGAVACVCRNTRRALARRAAHEGGGKNSGPGPLIHKMCLEFLPFVEMINLSCIGIAEVDINVLWKQSERAAHAAA